MLEQGPADRPAPALEWPRAAGLARKAGAQGQLTPVYHVIKWTLGTKGFQAWSTAITVVSMGAARCWIQPDGGFWNGRQAVTREM